MALRELYLSMHVVISNYILIFQEINVELKIKKMYANKLFKFYLPHASYNKLK